MFCENCGSKLPEGAAFCENCGFPAASQNNSGSSAVQSSTPVNVPQSDMYSGAAQSSEPVNMPQGNIYSNAPQNNTPPYTPSYTPVNNMRGASKNKTNMGAVIGIIVAVLLLAAVAVLFATGIIKLPFGAKKEETIQDAKVEQPVKEDTTTGKPIADDQKIDVSKIDNSAANVNKSRIEYVNNVYEDTCNEYNIGNLSGTDIGNNASAYADYNGALKLIISNADISTTKQYFYEYGSLIAVNYSGAQNDRFYLDNDKLIMWKHDDAKDAKASGIYYNESENFMFRNVEDIVKAESAQLMTSYSTALSNIKPDASMEDISENSYAGSEYVLPDSDTRYITYSDLYYLDKEQCRIARNEIFARYGRKFKDAALQEHFNSCSWYYPSIEADDFNEKMLNNIEIANMKTIVDYEKEQGYR